MDVSDSANVSEHQHEPQVAQLIVFSHELSAAQIASIIGSDPDFAQDKGAIRRESAMLAPAEEASWTISEEGRGSVDLDDAVTKLLTRIRIIGDRIIAAHDQGCTVKLDIEQHVSEHSRPGLYIEAEDVKLLARMGAAIDIDQYLA